jgi:hypothetical protein
MNTSEHYSDVAVHLGIFFQIVGTFPPGCIENCCMFVVF